MLSNLRKQEKEENNIEEENQYIVFTVEEQEFGVEIKKTKEIINMRELTDVPSSPDFVRGVINLRGEIVPIVDLHKRLHIKEKTDDSEGKIIVVEMDENLVGMQVSEVKGIIRLSSNNIGSAPELTQDIKQDYIEGVGKLEDKLLILLNLQKVLTRQEVAKLEDMDL